MNEKQYQSLCGWAARTPARQKCLTACFRLLPVLFVFLYGIGSVCTLSALVQKQVGLWIAAFWTIPAAGFLLVTLIRKKLNRPRPAQLFHFVPLVQHEDGCSFPSRHTSSAFFDYLRSLLALPIYRSACRFSADCRCIRRPHRLIPRRCRCPFSP